MTRAALNTHRCPRHGCGAVVPNRLFACARDWAVLPPEVRALITRTARKHVLDPERRAAFRAADQAWGQ